MLDDDASAFFRRRLAARYDTSVYPVLLVKVVPDGGLQFGNIWVNTPQHFMAAAWLPAEQGANLWPEAVVIGAPAPDNALAELCRRIPRDARLFLVDADSVNAALAAEILLRSDRNLEAYQRDGIAAFIEAERARVSARIEQDYSDLDESYARFRATLTPRDP
jgi:hypothetical protein